MSKNLDLKVIAEGVESHSELDFLENNGCLLYQGFLFSRPLPESEFIELMKAGNTFTANQST